MKQVSNAIGGVVVALVVSASSASAQQVMWKDNPISGKVVGLTYGTSGWNAAEAQAVAYGGHLVTIRSAQENQWLVSQFSADWNTQGAGPWLGLSDSVVEGDWRWVSGEQASYRNWLTGMPDDAFGGQDYAFFRTIPSPDVWDDIGAVDTRGLIEVPQRPLRSWSWPTAFMTGSTPCYGSTFDMDGDGDFDFASPDRSADSVTIWRNNGTGGFVLVSTVSGFRLPYTCVGVDWDSDGDQDIVCTNDGGYLGLIRNNGSVWQFVNLGSVPRAVGLAVHDFNSDSRADVVVTSIGLEDKVSVILQASNGQLGAMSTYQTPNEPYQPTLDDLDDDGIVDLVVACDGGVVLFKGLGGTQFQNVGAIGSGWATKVTLADLDSNGSNELLIPRWPTNALEVWSKVSGGALSPSKFLMTQAVSCPGGPYWSSVADQDNDGDLDVAVGAQSGPVSIWRNSGGVLSLDHVLNGLGYSLYVAFADLDGNATPDILSVSHFGNAFNVSINQGFNDCNGNGVSDSQDLVSGFATDCNSNGRPDSCETLIPANDCNGDSILDACQLTALTDCNSNARLDTCDLAAGAPDCNGNQILDVCEQLTAANDCNANGLLDYCELVAGTVPDCDLNGRPDSCDLAAGLPDCNLNQVPDTCDIGAGTSNDGDFNNIPDECSLDCNANGLLDTAECAQGLTADCNGNLVPDSCDLVAGVPDCNTNGVPDSCDVAGGQDCNANGQPDACDLAAGASDCNGNQQLDSCELAAGFGDCNANQQFDACELLAGAPDCNGNGALDACDIAAGAADCDGNQVPDACQPLDATSDCNANLILDVCDILAGALDCNLNGRPDTCDADTNGDQIPDDCQDGGTPYCFGDGAANSTPCPCGGVGAPRSGCPNSANPAGGYLVATGLPSRIADTLVLRASQMPPVATMLYFQGTSQASTASGTIGTVFGDGLRCAAGAVVRLGFRTNSAGASEIPSGGSPALHIAGLIPATGAVTRYYQGWYRDVNPSFCTANRYNLTNGVAVVWVP